jgi:hypothetical protein
MPVTPSSTISDRAPARVAITGTPQAIASTAGRPNPSYSDGKTTTWLRLYNRTSSSVLARGRTVMYFARRYFFLRVWMVFKSSHDR